jgi:hypothetical protein
MKEKQIQIPESLYNDILTLLDAMYCHGLPCHVIDVYSRVAKQIDAKEAKRRQHNLYTQYKTNEREDLRELARTLYVESVGIPEDFRY